jgi:hypothetical protein
VLAAVRRSLAYAVEPVLPIDEINEMNHSTTTMAASLLLLRLLPLLLATMSHSNSQSRRRASRNTRAERYYGTVPQPLRAITTYGSPIEREHGTWI